MQSNYSYLKDSIIEKPRQSTTNLPLKTTLDSNNQSIMHLKSAIEEYRKITKNLLKSVHFFFEMINNKYSTDLLVNEKQIKLYENFFDLFNFNHFNVKIEIEEFIKKESEISKSIDHLTMSNTTRTESVAIKNIYSSGKNEPEIKINSLLEKIQKLKNKNYKLKESNKKCHKKYLDLLKHFENHGATPPIDKLKIKPDFNNNNDSPRHRPHSLIIKDSGEHILNDTFEIFPHGATVSVNAFNPDNLSFSQSYSQVFDITRAKSIPLSKFENCSISPDRLKSKSRKKDIERHISEIDMLSREVKILKRELKEERLEKTILVAHYERSVIYEKESNNQIIKNLKNKLTSNFSEENRSLSYFEPRFESGLISNGKQQFEEDKSSISNNEFASILNSKIIQKNQTVSLLKKSLGSMLIEKRQLQGNLNEKTKEIGNLQSKLDQLENKTNVFTKQMSELELTNSHLTTKFMMAVEREGDCLLKYNQMKMKISVYEKMIQKLKARN